jgi:hypothetical protein
MRKSIVAAALLIGAACSSDGGTGPAVVTTVEVSSQPTQITVNGTAQAAALIKDQNGNAISGKTATWLSLNPGVATVNSAGLITGISPGTAVIQGTVDGVKGSVSILVIAAVAACNTGVTVVDLPIGGVRFLTSDETKGCIKVPAATAAPADYLVIAANTNIIPDIVGNYVFKSDEGETVPSTNLVPNNSIEPTPVPQLNSALLGQAQLGFETRLRLEERRELNMRDAAKAYQSRMTDPRLRASVSVVVPAIGDQTTFKVPQPTDACNKFTTITATVQYVNDKTIIYSDNTTPSGGFTATDYQQIGDEFSNLIYPTDVSYFGTPLDLDNNGRVIMLYTPQINKLTGSGEDSFVGGFFFAGDLFPSTPPKPGDFACPQSNVAELFYLLVPDPNGTINNNKRSTSTVRQGTRGTIAHEFQHMINSSNRIRISSPEFEVVWLDEALAHFAEDAVGRAVRGLGEASNSNFSATYAGNVDDFNAFFYQNFARYQIFVKNPGPLSPTSSLADSSLGVRGAAWSLIHYTADQYAPGSDVKAYIKSLAAGPDTGIVNLTEHAGNVAYDTLIKGWMLANYADDSGVSGLSSLYSYKVYNMRSNEQGSFNGAPYPLKLNLVTGSGFVLAGLQARSGSGNYFFAQRDAGSPARSFRFLNADGATAASFTGATWILLRTR